ncbi:MAG: ABC transporter permease [Lachnospiraceae bacterium]|nr:ABC transporter permease [Lachnospiraceae bacterium]
MKKFGIVLRYELSEYFNSKGFVIFTLLLALGGAVLLFLPRFIDLSGFTGVQTVGGAGTNSEADASGDETEKTAYLYLDTAGVVRAEVLQQMFPMGDWQPAQSEEALIAAVKAQEAEAGFVVLGPDEYRYYVFNKAMTDSNAAIFSQAMKQFYRMDYCETRGLDLNEIMTVADVPITVEEQVLNKDSGSNYWYCYFLVIVVFMLIVLYGQMIAVAVTNEKSNRAIEVLVTSTTPNSLLFGKVIAGAIGGLLQTGIIMGAVLVSYEVNRQQWGGMLDMFLHIPLDVIISFAAFGLGGYLFYAFLYGAMGALVSKTEDVSKSSGGLQVVIMVVYFFSLVQLMDIDGPITRVLSFLPISSYSTMFARIAMGTVAPWEIVVSFLILVVSILGAGVLGAKLYRMGTLRYGNPLKLSTALKSLRRSE